MQDSNFISKCSPLYDTYSTEIRPLISEIEARFEEFPVPILNEIRAFNDHVARCYQDINNEAFVDEQLKKSKIAHR
jgi:hypothetical protein